ncbi:YiiD C-terminal domain-containing protein [Fulvivirga lutea]|uniref:YiiD C-terminal domain-containing protein n=2 Tax=Fulvivirga lutea TaxID=2810512 RepID=A0A974WJL8_9BACT|nr:YiiD C-terminal domain-containing protein [Fulvivirga lutea]
MKLINWWPPMLGTGISLKYISKDFSRFDVIMKLRWYNKNLVGIHYGGSLYSMCDPWYMFILTANLGKKYIVMDKSAAIRYKKPGKGTVKCTFQLSQERISEIRKEINEIGKNEYTFLCEILNSDGEVICEVDKTVYVRKKDFDWDVN